MHFPERWGIVNFSAKPIGSCEIVFEYPEDEVFGKYLWLIYYNQQKFRNLTGNFAASLSNLNLEDRIKTESGDTLFLQMEKTETGFNAFLNHSKGLKRSINQDGLFQKIIK